jgi:hexosaminidase
MQFESPTDEGVAEQIGLLGFEAAESFALELGGYVRVPESAVYTFHLTSDDGSELVIDGQVVVDNDGYHGLQEEAGMVALEAGFHPITVRYFQARGGKALSLKAEIEGPVGRSQVDLRFAHER